MLRVQHPRQGRPRGPFKPTWTSKLQRKAGRPVSAPQCSLVPAPSAGFFVGNADKNVWEWGTVIDPTPVGREANDTCSGLRCPSSRGRVLKRRPPAPRSPPPPPVTFSGPGSSGSGVAAMGTSRRLHRRPAQGLRERKPRPAEGRASGSPAPPAEGLRERTPRPPAPAAILGNVSAAPQWLRRPGPSLLCSPNGPPLLPEGLPPPCRPAPREGRAREATPHPGCGGARVAPRDRASPRPAPAFRPNRHF